MDNITKRWYRHCLLKKKRKWTNQTTINNCCCSVFGFSYTLNSKRIRCVFAVEIINSDWANSETNSDSIGLSLADSTVATSMKVLPSQIFHIIYSDHANMCMPKGELGVCGHWALVQANESVHYLIEYKDIQMLIWFRPECKFPYYYPNVFLRLRLYSRWLLFCTLL